MAADGSIVIETNIDNKKAQKELNQLAKKIQSLEDQLTSKKQGRFPLVENLNAVNAELEEARKQLSMLQDEQNAINAAMKPGSSADDYMRAYSDRPMVDSKLKKQQEKVDAIEKEWRQAEKALSDYDSKISGLEGKLNLAKEEAGGLQQNMAKSGPAAAKMAKSVDRAQKSASKFSSRMREVIRSALVFTVITQGLAKFREWMGKVIKTNDEARASIARLKGALLTLAQPMIEVIIPAFTSFVDMLARIILVQQQRKLRTPLKICMRKQKHLKKRVRLRRKLGSRSPLLMKSTSFQGAAIKAKIRHNRTNQSSQISLL